MFIRPIEYKKSAHLFLGNSGFKDALRILFLSLLDRSITTVVVIKKQSYQVRKNQKSWCTALVLQRRTTVVLYDLKSLQPALIIKNG
jgi:hypothetical protein